MSFRAVILTVGLLAAGPALADSTNAAAEARNAGNLAVLNSLYPKRALAAREQGQVGFMVKIDSSGQPTECQVTKSSGYPQLDRETCDLITLHAVFKRPEGISGSQVSVHQGVVNWKLPNSMTVVATGAPKPVASAEPPEKKICRKVPRTGSLVSTERVCMTATQWKRQSDESKQSWEELQGRRGSTNGN